MHRPMAALAFALLMAAAAPGTTLSAETTSDLIAIAERICCAAVDSVESRRDPRSGFVFTHVRVRLLEEWKGRSETPVIELRLPGGRADGVETMAPGMPRFEKGAEAVLLLGPSNRDGFPVILQASGGVLGLRVDQTGRRCLRAPVTGLPELEGAREVTLDSFRTAVQRVVREQAERIAREAGRAGETPKPGASAPADAAPGTGDRTDEPAAGTATPREEPRERGGR